MAGIGSTLKSVGKTALGALEKNAIFRGTERMATRAVGAGAMKIKTLGKVGKESAEAASEVGSRVGKNLDRLNDVAEDVRKTKDAYKSAIREARKPTSSAADDAIKNRTPKAATRNSDSYFEYDGSKYRKVNTYDENGNITGRTYGKYNEKNGKYTNIDGKTYGKAHKGAKSEGNSFYASEEDLNLASELAETGAHTFDGLVDWAKEHPLIAAGGIATVGVGTGALLFGDDDDDYYPADY